MGEEPDTHQEAGPSPGAHLLHPTPVGPATPEDVSDSVSGLAAGIIDPRTGLREGAGSPCRSIWFRLVLSSINQGSARQLSKRALLQDIMIFILLECTSETGTM